MDAGHTILQAQAGHADVWLLPIYYFWEPKDRENFNSMIKIFAYSRTRALRWVVTDEIFCYVSLAGPGLTLNFARVLICTRAGCHTLHFVPVLVAVWQHHTVTCA